MWGQAAAVVPAKIPANYEARVPKAALGYRVFRDKSEWYSFSLRRAVVMSVSSSPFHKCFNQSFSAAF